MGFKIKKPSITGAGIGSAIGGAGLGLLSGGVLAPVGAAAGGAIGGYLPEIKDKLSDWKKAIDGESGNEAVPTLTPEQKALMDKYLSSLYSGSGNTVNTLQGYADKAYNPYDAVEGDRLVGEMRGYINDDAKAQIDALKGGAMNRFSLASNKAMRDIDDSRRKQLTELNYKNLMDKTGFAQQSYQNQNDAISKLFSMSSAMVGQGAFQNQQTYSPGWLDRIGQASNIIGTGASVAKLFL